MTDTKKVAITKTSPLCSVKSLMREVDTCLPLFLLWEKFAFGLQLGKLTKIQFRPKTYITTIFLWTKLYGGGRGSGRICNNHAWDEVTQFLMNIHELTSNKQATEVLLIRDLHLLS